VHVHDITFACHIVSNIIVKKHGGSLEVKSDGYDRGCTFTVYLNISPTRCSIITEGGHDDHPRLSEGDFLDEEAQRLPYPLRVLVVDDSKLNRKILIKVLSKYVTHIEEVCKAVVVSSWLL
jgi:hypothetical protein